MPIFHLHTANIRPIAHLPNIITTRATHARALTPDTLIYIEVIPIISKAVLVTTGNNIIQEVHGMPCCRVKNIQQFCNLELKRKLIQRRLYLKSVTLSPHPHPATWLIASVLLTNKFQKPSGVRQLPGNRHPIPTIAIGSLLFIEQALSSFSIKSQLNIIAKTSKI